MPSKSFFRLLAPYKTTEPQYTDEEVVTINQVIGKIALVYEKIRNAVDFREEHLLRKNAIFRILKRKLIVEKLIINQTEEKLAEQIVCEMIRAGYLKNRQEPKFKIKQVYETLLKYKNLIDHANLSQKDYIWVLEVEACEIEEILIEQSREKALIRFAFEVMNSRVVTSRGEIDNKEKELQLFIAINRALRKSDDVTLAYTLWNLYYPSWKTADDSLILDIAKRFTTVKQEITEQLDHPWKKSLLKIARQMAVVFWITQDIILKDTKGAEEIFSDPERLELEVNKACDARYKTVAKKLHRGAFRSIIYVFFTKMLLILVLELPLDTLLHQTVNYMALMVNIAFPPLLMALVAITITPPGKKNTEMIIKEITGIAFNHPDQKKFKLKAPKKRHFLITFILNIIYLAVFAICVWAIYRGLLNIGFSWPSIVIFVFFLSVVSFFGLRIRRPIKEISIVEKRDNLFTLLIDLFSLPFATVGQWTSVKISKLNVFTFIFDMIIEAPFKILIEVFEDLFSFWREKKEEVSEEV